MLIPKAFYGIQMEVAHQLALNYGDPITSMDATMCVSVEGTPYLHTPGVQDTKIFPGWWP